MKPPPPPPPQELHTAPGSVQVYVQKVQGYVHELEAHIADLEAQLRRDSTNSSQPPSADPPHAKPAPPKKRSNKRRGGQPGHPKHDRPLLPPDTVVELKAPACGHCRAPLTGNDPAPLVAQVHELPPVQPHVTEYRRHRLTCAGCGHTTCPALPADARTGYGPRAEAIVTLLSGAYRLGKRAVTRLCDDLFGLSVAPGTVCKLQARTAAALEPVYAEAQAALAGQPANVDETGWRQGKKRAWLWVAVTAAVTLYLIRPSRARAVLRELLPGPLGVLTTDRYPVYDHLPVHQRQVCWAHLRRDFQAAIDRRNAGSRVGRGLLAAADVLLQQWHRVRDGTLTRAGFERRHLLGVQRRVRALLRRGAGGLCAPTASLCRELQRLEPALWTFAAVPGVEPTNNAAERALRHAVCWRKTSYGTDSAAGSRFVERVLTAVETCRQHGRDVLAFLTETIHAARTGATPPALLPAATPRAA